MRIEVSGAKRVSEAVQSEAMTSPFRGGMTVS